MAARLRAQPRALAAQARGAGRHRGRRYARGSHREVVKGLQRKLVRAEKRLEVAEQVIAAPKKLRMLLGLPSAPEDESSS